MRLGTALAFALALTLQAPARADTAIPPGDGDAIPIFEDGLSADAIYERVLENRFESSIQELALLSGDRGGHEQKTRIQMLWRRDPEDEEIVSRTLIRYLEPSDLRNTGYLIMNRRDGPDDQFIHLQSMRRTRRINLRTEALAGTDISVEDLVPKEFEDATYRRILNEDVEEAPCFVIEAVPKPDVDSDYSKIVLYVEKEHFVPLRTRYWDKAGVEVKELRTEPDAIREIEGIHLPVRARMRQLVLETFTDLRILVLVPNPELADRYFSQRQLESKRLSIPKEHFEGMQRLHED